MKLQINGYLLFIFLVVTIFNITSFGSEEIQSKEEYKLIIDYRTKLCVFIDKNTDTLIKKECFYIANRLYQLTENKAFLYSIAKHYWNGYGVAQDLKKSLKLIEELANSDHDKAIQAQSILGLYYGAVDAPSAIRDPIKG